MNKKRAVINIAIGIIFKIILLILAVITKSVLVKKLGNEANGLFSLYTSVLGFITIANLGIGSAITYSMYKPIVENDKNQISALYHLYKKFYLIVMLVILGVGLLATPLIPYLAKGSTENNMIYITYVTYLLSIAITYLFGHKVTLINAYKDNYITTITHSISLILESVIQIIVLIITKNFFYFLLVRIFAYLIEGFLIEVIFRKKYKQRINKNKTLDENIKKEVIKNSGAKVYSEIGYKLISSFDGMIISFFVGVISLGLYSNYIVVISGMFTLLNLIFSEITSIVGQQYVKQTKEKYYEQFEISYTINFIVGIVFFLGYIFVSHNLIEIMFSREHIMTDFIMITIAFDYYINFMRRTPSLFKNASGIFYQDRHRPLIEGIVNIILSIILVQFLGVGGVLIATIITRLIISYTYEPYILFKDGFQKPVKSFYKVHYGTFIIMIILTIMYIIIPTLKFNNVYLNLFMNGLISIIISMASLGIIYIIYKPFRKNINKIFKEISKVIKRSRG